MVYPRIKSEIQYNHPQKKMAQDRRQNYIVNSLPSSKDIKTLPYHSDKGRMDDSDVLVGKVVQYSDDFKRINVILDNGKYYWLHDSCFSRKLGRKVDLRREFPVNTYIRFRDLGKSAEGFKVYEFVSSERK